MEKHQKQSKIKINIKENLITDQTEEMESNPNYKFKNIYTDVIEELSCESQDESQFRNLKVPVDKNLENKSSLVVIKGSTRAVKFPSRAFLRVGSPNNVFSPSIKNLKSLRKIGAASPSEIKTLTELNLRPFSSEMNNLTKAQEIRFYSTQNILTKKHQLSKSVDPKVLDLEDRITFDQCF